MKKIIITLFAIISTNAGAADCSADLKPLCEAAAGFKKHEGIYLQINPTKNVRFEQTDYQNFVSINDRSELAENYGAEGEAAREAVQSSMVGVRKLASKRREPVYVLITREGKVFKGDEIRASVSKENAATQK
jgi:hypothetical protein